MRFRVALSAVLIVIATVAACGAIFARWTNDVLLDTDTFIAAVEPIVGDDDVRDAAGETIANAILDVVDLRAAAESLIPGDQLPLVEEIATEFEVLVSETVGAAVRTDAAAQLWLSEMRVWHLKVVGAVRASDSEYTADGTVMRVSLGPYVDLLAEQTGSGILERLILALVPDTVRTMQVAVFDGELIADRIEILRYLAKARPYLPWIASLSLLLALIVAPKARYALLGAGISLGLGGFISMLLSRAEAARIADLARETFSASSASTTAFSGVIFGPLQTWLGYLMLSGGIVAIVGALAVRFGAGSEARESTDQV